MKVPVRERFAKPDFGKPRRRRGRGWFVMLGVKQIPLGKDRETESTAFHKLMQQRAAALKVRA